MKKRYLPLLLLLLASFSATRAQVGQALDFRNTQYYILNATALYRDTTLAAFNYSGADTNHPIFHEGMYFPAQDYQNRNLWVRVRHIAHDPNGTSVGWNVPATWGDPFRNGLGGWQGFLYQFDIYADVNLTGPRDYHLAGLFPNTITLESLETLSSNEWLMFKILNPQSSGWSLNSINFTGSNPSSDPQFSDTARYWQPPSGGTYSPNFPNGAKYVAIEDGDGGSYSEFRMSANDVSSFLYGYEYSQSFGYQGMNLKFGLDRISATRPQATPTLSAYPNPTTGRLTLRAAAAFGMGTLYLTDGLGRRIDLPGPDPAATAHQVSLTDLPPGLYQLVWEGEAGATRLRIVRR